MFQLKTIDADNEDFDTVPFQKQQNLKPSDPVHRLSVLHDDILQEVATTPVVEEMVPAKQEKSLMRFVKRTVDVVLSASALTVLSPLFIALAIAVKSDGGPAFFSHRRIGYRGVMFNCLKFRSMVMHADEILKSHLANNPEAMVEWQADHKLKNDPRVTRFGAWMRKTSLDELPQLINVLKGEMSLVGPRPIVQAEVAKYGKDIAFYYQASPGITGLWQVSGRNDTTYSKRVALDCWYVKNGSIWVDIAILFKTIPALLKGRGAY